MINYANEKVDFDGCPGCAYGRHEFVLPCGMAYEDEDFTLSQDWELPIVGFFVVSPKRHVSKLSELTLDEQVNIFGIVDEVIKILRNHQICDEFNVVFEEKGGRHFHIWIMPRQEWMLELFGNPTGNIKKVFEYAKKNMRTEEVYHEIDHITKIVGEEMNSNHKRYVRSL